MCDTRAPSKTLGNSILREKSTPHKALIDKTERKREHGGAVRRRENQIECGETQNHLTALASRTFLAFLSVVPSPELEVAAQESTGSACQMRVGMGTLPSSHQKVRTLPRGGDIQAKNGSFPSCRVGISWAKISFLHDRHNALRRAFAVWFDLPSIEPLGYLHRTLVIGATGYVPAMGWVGILLREMISSFPAGRPK